MSNSNPWPETLPIITSQEELVALSYKYAHSYRTCPGLHTIFYKIFPDSQHRKEVLATFVIVCYIIKQLQIQLDHSQYYNLTICCLGYTDGHSTETLSLFQKVKEHYVRTYPRQSRTPSATTRTANTRPIKRSIKRSSFSLHEHKEDNTPSNDGEVLPQSQDIRTSPKERRSKNKPNRPTLEL